MNKKMYLIPILALLMIASGPARAMYSMDTYSKTDIMKMVASEAIRQDVSPALALSIAKVESGFQPGVVSSAGAIGVMQIMPSTGKSEFNLSRADLFNPQLNIQAGIQFIKDL